MGAQFRPPSPNTPGRKMVWFVLKLEYLNSLATFYILSEGKVNSQNFRYSGTCQQSHVILARA